MKTAKKVTITREEEKVIKKIIDFIRYDFIDFDSFEIVELLSAIADGEDQWNDYGIVIEKENIE